MSRGPARLGTARLGEARQGKRLRPRRREKKMKIAIVKLKGQGNYSQSKNIDRLEYPEKPKESKEDYEKRTWRYRLHVSATGHVEIPPTAFGNAVRASARRLQIQVPGKGKTQYTKYFEAGIDVAGPLELKLKAADVQSERLFVPSDGKPGGEKRVWRYFPIIPEWGGEVTFYILDDIITEEVFTKVIKSAGLLVGIGRFRPEKRGFYGRFTVEKLKWIENGEEMLGAAAE
jgi:hypothetical protein